MAMTKKEREENRKAWEEKEKRRKEKENTLKLIKFMRGDIHLN